MSTIAKVARIYLRVSTDEQSLERQQQIEQSTREAGFYIAGVYEEKASGVRADRPELLRMIDDLQPGDLVVAERMDRISRLPLVQAQQLVQSIRAKGARLAVPGVIDLSSLTADVDGVARIVMESVQEMLLNLALQMAHDDYVVRRARAQQGIEKRKAAQLYRGKSPDLDQHKRIILLREQGVSIAKTAKAIRTSESQVKKVWAGHCKAVDAATQD